MSGLHIQRQRNFHVMRWTLALTLLSALSAYAYFGVRWYSTGELSPLPLPVAATDATIDERELSQKQIHSHSVAAHEPRYVEIPKLGVITTRVMRVGVTERNMLDVPRNLSDVGWYQKSASPGSGAGAVVLDGHSSGATRDGVFAKLATLARGDQVTIERGDGTILTYEVHDVREMPIEWVNKIGMKEMMKSAQPNKEGLSLIANSGRWVPKDKVFDRRVLVRATIVE